MRLLLVLPLLAACSATLKVTSSPPGARILLNGQDTGEVTPAELTGRELGGGGALSVALDGHEAAEARPVTATTSVRAIIGSVVFPVPVGVVNLLSRGFADAEPRELHFELRPHQVPPK